MTKYILFLLIGHVLGDFYFQTQKISSKKAKYYKWVIIHSLEYLATMLAMAVIVFHVEAIIMATCAGIVHFLIDTAKFIFVKKTKTKRQWNVFCLDQILHVVSIITMCYFFDRFSLQMNTTFVDAAIASCGLDSIVTLKWILSVLLILNPSNIMIQMFLSEFKPIESRGQDIINREKNAGRMVGSLERIIMLILLFNQQYSALGLVLTAKSITRYNKITEDKAFAEYYLLGTLLSVLVVLVVGHLILI